VNVPNEATELIRILHVIEESLNLPLLYQWLEISEDILQFPNETTCQTLSSTLESASLPFQLHPSSLFLVVAFRNGRGE